MKEINTIFKFFIKKFNINICLTLKYILNEYKELCKNSSG